MHSNERIAQLLIETGAYSDLSQPVILTSGQLGIFYINTEKLCQDGGEFKKHGDSSTAMCDHAVRMYHKHETFKEVIDILVEKTDSLMRKQDDKYAISGGQRRDWLFSGPVAVILGLPHVGLYKQEEGKPDKIEMIIPGVGMETAPRLNGRCIVHIADLMTEASSAYRIEGEEEKGWIPMLRNAVATVEDYLAVVTRLQGGEERLAEQGVKVHSFVAINEAFLRQYSSQPDIAIAYLKDPTAWSEQYLRENGALALLGNFDPEGGKIDRAKKFLERYFGVLGESDKLNELTGACQKKYGKTLIEICGGELK